MIKWVDNLLNKIALNFVKKKYKEGDILWRSLFSGQSKGIIRNPYEVSAWVFGAVNAIARNISRIPYNIYKGIDDINSTLTANILKEGELIDLFKRPNKLSTWRQHIMGTAISLELNGEAFWILDRSNVSEIPKEIWLVNPTRFEPIWDKNNTKIIGWKYRNKNIELDFSLAEIIFFKYPNPYDDLRGLAPLSAATLGISQDYYAAEFNKKFFEEGAAVSGVIEVEDELSPEAYTRLLAAFEERHKGYTKAHRVVLIEGGGKFTPYTPSYRDFEFTSLRRLNKEEILTAFGVNPVIVGDYKDIKCYHPDTYVLTSKGFIKISEVKVGDLVASMDLNTKEVDYYPVSNTYSYFYDGYLYKPANNHFAYGVDFQVTPEHKIVVSDIDDNLSLIPIDKINANYRYVKYGKFNNKGNSGVIVIEDDKGNSIGFPLKSFISILAWYLACGSITSDKIIKFNIKTPESRNKFRYYCEKFSEYIDQTSQITFVLTDKKITSMILTYITQDKKITRKLLDLDPSYLYHFIYIFSQTDVVDKGDRTALTYSFNEDSVNAFMEMCVKCNIPAFYATVGSQLKTYILKLSFIAPKDTYFDGLEKVPYTGKVYCLEVKPHHNLCIMFNGKVSWSGNSYEGINAAHRAFWIETIVPKAELISDVINYQFMRYLKDGTYKFAFDFNSIEALREDFYRKVDSAERLYQIGFPINMINRRLNLGMDDVEWGDIWWVDQRRVPVDEYMEQWENLSKDNNNENEPDEKDIKMTPELYFVLKKIDNSFRKFFFEQRKEVLKKIDEASKDYKTFPFVDFIDKNKEIDKFVNQIMITYKELFPTLSDHQIKGRLINIANILIPDIVKSINTIVERNGSISVLLSKIKQFYNFVLAKCLEISKIEAIELLNNKEVK